MQYFNLNKSLIQKKTIITDILTAQLTLKKQVIKNILTFLDFTTFLN